MSRRGRGGEAATPWHGRTSVAMGLGLVVVVSVAVAVSLGARMMFDFDRRGDQRTNPSDSHRPALHFSSSNWVGGPSGAITLDEQHHLFFQHNPDEPIWGDIGWGHAVSGDLVTWSELDMARSATATSMVFPGSVVADPHDTSGLCRRQPCLVAVYTVHSVDAATGLTQLDQHLATSLDGGETWDDYAHNPVLSPESGELRDPNVFWHDESSSWIMAAALPLDRVVRIYRSDDLRQWEHASDFGPAGVVEGVWECPVLFELEVDGTGTTRWVLKVDHHTGHLTGGSGAQYFVGDFDGSAFVAETARAGSARADDIRWVDHGPDFTCALPIGQGTGPTDRWIGWLNNWTYAEDTPTDRWRGALSLPRTVGLTDVDGELTLTQTPAVDLTAHRREYVRVEAGSVDEAAARLAMHDITGAVLEIRLRPDPGRTGTIGIGVHVGDDVATVIEYDAEHARVSLDRTRSTTEPFHADYPRRYEAVLPGGALTELHVVVDRSSVEVFADGVAVTALVFPPPDAVGIELYSSDVDDGAVTLDIWTLEVG
jgi:fructan beta-fructosidase